MNRLLLLLVLSLVASPLAAQCEVQLRYENGEIRWNQVPGATGYQVQESVDNLATSRNYFVRASVLSFKVQRRASSPAKLRYYVTATYLPGVQAQGLVTPQADACTGEIEIEIPADPAFRAMTRRAIVPVVGSTPGAQGGRFKTSLRLISGAGALRGRIVFHPIGRASLPGDPSIPYRLSATGDSVSFDDIVAELGQNGLGSLDIVPDSDAEGIVPRVEARLFNDTEAGTFGSFAPVVYPYDYLQPSQATIDVPDARFRVNLGIRTLEAVTVQALIYGTNGRLRALRELSFPAEYTIMTTPAQFLGTDLQPGESVTLIPAGAAIVFHTITENRTNDPTLVVAPPRAGTNNVGAYVD